MSPTTGAAKRGAGTRRGSRRRWRRSSINERQLVDAFLARRDEASFRELYRRASPRLFLLALRLTGRNSSDAEDVLQETWLRACAQLPRFRGESSLQTWLSGILINCWRETRRASIETEELDEIELAQQPETRELESLVAQLPERARAVFVLHDVEGRTHEEIGAMLSIAAGTSKHQLFRARKLLRAWLGEEQTNESE